MDGERFSFGNYVVALGRGSTIWIYYPQVRYITTLDYFKIFLIVTNSSPFAFLNLYYIILQF